ncbi:hypothetical protein IC608_11400 [Devosia sp. PTR5]|uniref:Uncharacterized protein n=1 Tax=Devosia oryzisoli TaxID=2774138 RepID=A0A927ITN7_9HYPH|nr:hypothetical protein [Devosia oryzisoli]MBD8066077.1 hypothetical protein [Devosia oryzisoli]
MDKIISTYEATAAGGASVTVYEVEADGLKRMQLSDGRPLKMVGDREFKIEDTDEVFLLDRPYSPLRG